ncbi:MAG: class II aldolase/adducin family protein [Desulfovibrio sp.]|nr:class II aldolase/adducin family protein [Desulfovibrio sp.]
MSLHPETCELADFGPREERFCYLLHEAWLKGLLCAGNGNASWLLPEPQANLALITAKGTFKGHLARNDLSYLHLPSGQLYRGQALSSETGVHLALYRSTKAQAILHTHPPKLLALELMLKRQKEEGACQNLVELLTKLPIYESARWQGFLGMVKAHLPGSNELALAVEAEANNLLKKNQECANYGAIWLSQHGLCAWGADLNFALALSEEMEHLANIALLANILKLPDGQRSFLC